MGLGGSLARKFGASITIFCEVMVMVMVMYDHTFGVWFIRLSSLRDSISSPFGILGQIVTTIYVCFEIVVQTNPIEFIFVFVLFYLF